jgi:hypothetical protein
LKGSKKHVYGEENMEVTLRVITDFNHLLEIEDNWNQQLDNCAANPFLFSRLLSEFMRLWEQEGWTPIVISFWLNNKIVGVVPLKLKKNFFSYDVHTLNDELYSDIFLCDKFRNDCLNQLLDFLFEKLNCRLVSITLQKRSPNIEILKNVCGEKGLNFLDVLHMGRACIALENDWNMYYKSFTRNARKNFRRIKNNLDRLGEWGVSCFKLTLDSIEKILDIEKMSWKARWRAKKRRDKDLDLMAFLNAFQQTSDSSYYDSEVWFLEVNGRAIAYQLTLFYRGASFFVKTSYDARFVKFSPGKFLIKSTMREMFKRKTVDMVDFITDLPFLRIYHPKIVKRERLYIRRKPLKLSIMRFIYRYPQIKRLIKIISDM